MKNNTFGSCGHFKQLNSGHWAGDKATGIWVSVARFNKGETPDGFKHEPCRPANELEAAEFTGALRTAWVAGCQEDWGPVPAGAKILAVDFYGECQCGQGQCFQEMVSYIEP